MSSLGYVSKKCSSFLDSISLIPSRRSLHLFSTVKTKYYTKKTAIKFYDDKGIIDQEKMYEIDSNRKYCT